MKARKTKKNKNGIKRTQIDIPKGLRVPRLRGTTLMAIEAHQTKDKKETIMSNIRKLYIDHYTLNNMTVLGRTVNIEDMATWLNIPTKYLLRELNREVGRIGNILQGKDGAQFTRALLMGLISKSLEAHSLIANQVHILSSQQGREYVPFLTSELNKILATLSTATKPVTEIVKLLTDNNPGVIINNVNGAQANISNSSITVDQAVNLIKSEGFLSMLEDEGLLNQKLLTMGTDLPEIRAQYQDLNSIGIKVPNKAIDGPNEPTKPYKDDIIEIQ